MQDKQERINQKVCFIAGAGHSGSTLLGFILGSHTDGFYSGEAAKTRYLNDESRKMIKRVCKICGENCPIWGDFSVDPTVDLYEQVALKVKKSLIIDSAKNVDWIKQQLDALEQTSAKPFLIFLQRDGRAVINSRLRKYPTQDVKSLIQNWIEQIHLTNDLFNSFPGHKIKIHYEELASDPKVVVEQICEFLNIEYQPQMLHYAEHEHHVLGGNNGTQFLVIQAQQGLLQPAFVTLSNRNKYYYEGHTTEIVLDLRWKQELDPTIERLFEAMAGNENQELKWDV